MLEMIYGLISVGCFVLWLFFTMNAPDTYIEKGRKKGNLETIMAFAFLAIGIIFLKLAIN